MNDKNRATSGSFDYDTQDPVPIDVSDATDEEKNVSQTPQTDDEALEVLLSRPGSALREQTSASVVSEEASVDDVLTGEVSESSVKVSNGTDDAEVSLVSSGADEEHTFITPAPEHDLEPPVEADPFADTGEHQQTPSVGMSEPPVDDAVDLEAINEDTTPHPEKRHINDAHFENAHTSPIEPQSAPRPAQLVPAPTPLPTSERSLAVTAPPLPAAPYTPPPPPLRATAQPLGGSVQQRVNAYAHAGYRLVRQLPNEIVMSYGKPLSFFWWVFGTASIFGIVWYWFVLLISGLQPDRVYIAVEPNGRVYEEGPGAAHVRYRRAQNARRWGVVGVFMILIAVFSLFLVILAGSVLLDRYEAELNAAYPEFGIFDNANVDTSNVGATEVQNVRIGALALIILMALSFSGLVIGSIMTLIGYLQSAAYRVEVAPLPYLR